MPPAPGRSSTPVLPLSMAELAELYASLVRSLELDRCPFLAFPSGRCCAAARLPIARAGPAAGAVRNRTRHRRAPRVGGRPPGARFAGAVLQRGPSRRVAPLIYGGRFAREPESFSRELQNAWLRHLRSTAYYCQLAALVGWSSLPWLGQHRGAYTRPCWRRGSRISDENAAKLGQAYPMLGSNGLHGGGAPVRHGQRSESRPRSRRLLPSDPGLAVTP